MGLLVDIPNTRPANILTEHGFSFSRVNYTGKISWCYERDITLGLARAWIAVRPEDGIVCIAVDFEGDARIVTHETILSTNWKDSPERFFKELDAYASETLATWEAEIMV